MEVVISLERTPQRLRWFRAMNPHIRAEAMPAVDGLTIDRADIIRRRVIAPALPFGDGALGCLMSHLAVWDRVIEAREAATVFEDDAVSNGDFPLLHNQVIADLPADWHIILWGWNFNAPMQFEVLPGVSSGFIGMDQDRARASLDAFRKLAVMPEAYRIKRAFGTFAYSISPGGASALKRLCLPVRPFSLPVPGLATSMHNVGLDVTLSAVYEQINAFVCFPPVVITPNYEVASTVR